MYFSSLAGISSEYDAIVGVRSFQGGCRPGVPYESLEGRRHLPKVGPLWLGSVPTRSMCMEDMKEQDSNVEWLIDLATSRNWR